MRFESLPSEWEVKKMPEVVKWSSGGTPKATEKQYYDGGTIPWLIIGDLNDATVTTSASRITELGLRNSSAKMIPVGTLLVAMYGSIGKLGITGIECCTNQAIAYAKELYGVTTKFMFYYMAFMKSELISKGKGGTQKNISLTVLNSLYVVVPTLSEQERIIARIEELFSQLDAGVETLKKTKAQLAVYRQAVLKEAFDGAYIDSNDYRILRIDSFATVETGATPLTTNKAYYDGKIAWVASGKINDGLIDTPTDYITDLAIKETNCKVFPAGTLLVAMYGEGKTRGKCAELMIPAATNQALAAIVLKEDSPVNKSFLKWYLNYNYQMIRRKASGGVQPNLNLGIIKAITIKAFSKAAQIETVNQIEARTSICDSIEQTVDAALQQAEAMRQTILKEAFEGRL